MSWVNELTIGYRLLKLMGNCVLLSRLTRCHWRRSFSFIERSYELK